MPLNVIASPNPPEPSAHPKLPETRKLCSPIGSLTAPLA